MLVSAWGSSQKNDDGHKGQENHGAQHIVKSWACHGYSKGRRGLAGMPDAPVWVRVGGFVGVACTLPLSRGEKATMEGLLQTPAS